MTRNALMVLFGLASLAGPVVAEPLSLGDAFALASGDSTASNQAVSRDGTWFVTSSYEPDARGIELPLRDLGAGYDNSGIPYPEQFVRLQLVHSATGRVLPLPARGRPAWSPAFSPDGKKLAYYSLADGQVGLWVCELKDGTSKRVGRVPVHLGIEGDDNPRWFPDNRSVLIGERVRRLPLRKLHNDRQEPVVFDSRKPPEAKISYFMQLREAPLSRLDVVTGQRTTVVPEAGKAQVEQAALSDDGHWLCFRSYQVVENKPTSQLVIWDVRRQRPLQRLADTEFVWDPRASRLLFLESGELKALDPVHQQTRTLAGKLEGPLVLAADQSYVWAKNPQGLVRISLSQEPSSQPVPLPAGYTLTGMLTSRPRTSWEPRPGQPVVRARRASDSTYSLIQLGGEGPRVLKEGLFRLDNTFTVGNQLYGTYQDTFTPPEVYRFQEGLSLAQPVRLLRPRLKNVKLGEVRKFSIRDKDGTRLTTGVIQPAHQPAGGRPPTIAIMYPGARASSGVEEFAGGSPTTIPSLVFLERGFSVLYLDLPLKPPGPDREVVKEMGEFVRLQLAEAARLGLIDRQRVAILGQSSGGWAAIALLTEPDLFAAGIGINGGYDQPSLYGYAFPNEELKYYIAPWMEGYHGRMGTHPWGDSLPRYLAASPYYQAHKIQSPVLLIHGGEDSAFPVADAQAMYLALKTLGKQVQLAIYPRQNHVVNLWRRDFAVDSVQRSLNFLEPLRLP
ncbi:MAG: S9 family peptidase [Candidatus Eremiobacteraeota bacterium]|nr:S9 family peptidase [Candidatus Eremiobacteraeota bacterium]MCW5869032.1 S9 family peptidase [Candidatus Eremiobacteraeota bacterium]